MKTMNIKLDGVYDTTRFVEEASKIEGTVLIKKGNITLDGTSLIGMLTLDTTDKITVYYPDNVKDFEIFIKQFEI